MNPRKWKITRYVLGAVWGTFCLGLTAFAIVESARDGDSSANESNIFDKKLHGDDLGPTTLESFSVSLNRYSQNKKASLDAPCLIGDYLTYSFTYLPSEAKGDISVVSSNPSVFASNATRARIEAVGEGEAKITFSAKEEGVAPHEYSFSCQRVGVTDVQIDVTSLTLGLGESYALKASALPANATNKALTYESDDPMVVSVSSSGVLRALSPGRTEIRVLSQDNPAVSRIVSVRVGELESLGFLEDEISAYPNQTVSFRLHYETSGEPFDKNRVNLSLNPQSEDVSLKYVSHDMAAKEAVYKVTFSDESLTAETVYQIELSYDNGFSRFEDSLDLRLIPLKPFDFLPRAQDVSKTVRFNSAYGEALPEQTELSVLMEYEDFDETVAYQYALPDVMVVPSPGLSVISADAEEVKLGTASALDPLGEYYFDFYPNASDLSRLRRFNVHVAYVDDATALTNVSFTHLKTVEDDGAEAVNVLDPNKVYEDYADKASFFPSEPFAESGVKAVIEGDYESAPIVNEEGVVDLAHLQGTGEEGEVTLLLQSGYEAEREDVRVQKRAKIRFESQKPTAFVVTGTIIDGECAEDVSCIIAPFEPIALQYMAYSIDPFDQERTYHPEASFEISDEAVVRYDAPTQRFLPIQVGEATVTFSSEGCAPFVLTLTVVGERVSLEDAPIAYEGATPFAGNPMAEDGSYCSVSTTFNASLGLPASLAGRPLTYESSDPSVLFVNDLGQCRALSSGNAEVICRLAENPSVSTSKSIRVYDSVGWIYMNSATYKGLAQTNYNDAAQGIKTVAGTTAIYFTEHIVIDIDPSCSARGVTYRLLPNSMGVDSAEIATVASDGTVTFKKEGVAVIQVTVGEEGSPYQKSLYVVYRVRTTLASSTSSMTRKQWGHLLLFFATVGCGLLCFFCLPIHNFIRWGSELFMPLYGFGLAYLTEYIQKLTPGRAFSWNDIWLDTRGGLYAAAVGAVIYLTIAIVVYVRKRKAKREGNQGETPTT